MILKKNKNRSKENTDQTKNQVYLVVLELFRVVQVHVLGVDGAVAGGQGKATEGVTAGTVFNGTVHNLLADSIGHGNLEKNEFI